ncbi:hypothetical protein ACTACK_26510 [Pseudomonas syringae]|uniref:hypothetical protein n=1 Tax=Pseudomonas syringae group TaxID=136849 RepID=UPI0010C115A5|nr:hypothetical protein [Pseudomonas viridiflava]
MNTAAPERIIGKSAVTKDPVPIVGVRIFDISKPLAHAAAAPKPRKPKPEIIASFKMLIFHFLWLQ